MFDVEAEEHFAKTRELQRRVTDLLGLETDWAFGRYSPQRGGVAYLVHAEGDDTVHVVLCCSRRCVVAMKADGLVLDEYL